MRTPRLFACLLAAAWLLPSIARAQCADWRQGPLQNGQNGNGTDGSVYALTSWDPDGAGPLPARLVAGGAFATVGGVATDNVAWFDPQGGQWHPFAGYSPFAEVRSLTADGNDLVAGSGTGFNDEAPVSRWTGSRWQALGGDYCRSDFTNMTADWVEALGHYNGRLVAGGGFTAWGDPNQVGGCGGQYGHGIAAFDGDAHWRYDFNYVTDDVLAMTQYGSDLFVGGSFGGYSCDLCSPGHRIARWDGTAWSSWGDGADDEVRALQVWNGGVVAAGGFSQIGGQALNRIAHWNGTAWAPLGPGFGSWVNCLTVYHGNLIAGGEFVTAGGVTVNRIAQWNGSAWQPLGLGMNAPVTCLTVWNDDLIAGGEFTSADGQTANHLARWDGTQWSSFGGGTANDVLAYTTYAGRLVAGGDFVQSTDTAQLAHDIVGWDGAVLAAYGTGMDGTVQALKAYTIGSHLNQTSELVAGGTFTHAGGVAAGHVAKWDQGLIVIGGSAWNAMGSGFDGPVYALERHSVGTTANTYAAGSFAWSGAVFVGNIARWNSTTSAWEALAAMNGPVYALRSYGGYLYAGGAFTIAGGVSTGGLARWNGSSWSACGGFFNGTVYALEAYGGQLVIGGQFPGIGGSPNLAEYNGAAYSTFGTGGANSVVRALAADGSRLFVGGDFTAAGNVPANHAAYWDGAWHDANGGASQQVDAIAAFHAEAHFGGTFGLVRNGSLPSPVWARWLETGVPWLVAGPSGQTVDSRANASFAVVPATGYEPLSYQWYKDGAPLQDGFTLSGETVAGATSPVLSLTRVESVDGGNYSVVVSDACGGVTGGPATLTIQQTVGVPAVGVPEATALRTLGPNPAPGPAQVSFALAHAAAVLVHVHDIAGRRVRVLALGSLPAGQHATTWDARDDAGLPVPTGLYLVELTVDGRRIGAKRIALVR